MKPRLLLLLIPWVTLPLVGSADVDVAVEIRLGKVPPPPPPEVIAIEPAPPPGPPPWAPAHGFRRNHRYYYYPGADVYFRPADRVWFYLEGSDWRLGASLPAGIPVDFDRSVALEMATDRPYQFHTEVRKYYPADYFVTKVRLKQKHESSEKHGSPDNAETDKRKSERAVDHPPGKAKGKGKNK